jgi:hypothetical protein
MAVAVVGVVVVVASFPLLSVKPISSREYTRD